MYAAEIPFNLCNSWELLWTFISTFKPAGYFRKHQFTSKFQLATTITNFDLMQPQILHPSVFWKIILEK